MIAHGAESHYKSASSVLSTLGEVATAFGWGADASKSSAAPPTQKALPAPPPSDSARKAMAASMTAKTADAAATPAWQRWGKYAMFAGAAGAVAAGGAAAYVKRDSITEGWTWVGGHLEFVGCLMRGEELQNRLERVMKLGEEKGIGFKDLVTVLGRGAAPKTSSSAGQPVRKDGEGFVKVQPRGGGTIRERTFCNVPKSERSGQVFEKLEIEQASDEIVAHCSIFIPKDHRGYYGMSERAKELIVGWVERGWYEGGGGGGGGGDGGGEVGSDGGEEQTWMGYDGGDEHGDEDEDEEGNEKTIPQPPSRSNPRASFPLGGEEPR